MLMPNLSPEQVMSERIYQAFPDQAQREIVTELAHDRYRQLAYYLAQTRYACDCLVQVITHGALARIPWEDMDPGHVGDGSSVRRRMDQERQQIITPPNRAERRQAARDFIKRAASGGSDEPQG